MSLSIQLYNNSADPRVLDKTDFLDALGSSLSCDVKNRREKMEPVFDVVYSSDAINADYLYCSTWNKYYYILHRVVKPGGGVELHCFEDVRMTFKTGIRSVNGIVRRSASSVNAYLADDAQRKNQYTRMQTIEIGSPLAYTTETIIQTVG